MHGGLKLASCAAWVEKVVALIRQPTVDSLPCSLALFLTPSDQVHMPERLSEGRVGVGVEVVSDERRLEVEQEVTGVKCT